MSVGHDFEKGTPEAQLRFFLESIDPKNQKLFRAVRSAMRMRFPSANELVYDYYTFVVIAYSPTEQPTDAVASIAGRTDGVRLYLMNGPKLPDPKKLLTGTGKQVRFIQIEAASQLAHPDVKALIAAAVERIKVPLPTKGKGRLVIRTISPKRRPRRKAGK